MLWFLYIESIAKLFPFCSFLFFKPSTVDVDSYWSTQHLYITKLQ